MNHDADFREWLSSVRFSRNVCMLIPMEACMGYPIVIRQGAEYIIPFFKVTSMEKTDALSPPFAYLRIHYPSAAILTYNNLRTLPQWRNTDWHAKAPKHETAAVVSGLDAYCKAISGHDSAAPGFDQQDALLLNCLYALTADDTGSSPLVEWYRKLIAEAKQYR